MGMHIQWALLLSSASESNPSRAFAPLYLLLQLELDEILAGANVPALWAELDALRSRGGAGSAAAAADGCVGRAAAHRSPTVEMPTLHSPFSFFFVTSLSPSMQKVGAARGAAQRCDARCGGKHQGDAQGAARTPRARGACGVARVGSKLTARQEGVERGRGGGGLIYSSHAPEAAPPAQLEARNDSLEADLAKLDARARALLPRVEEKLVVFEKVKNDHIYTFCYSAGGPHARALLAVTFPPSAPCPRSSRRSL